MEQINEALQRADFETSWEPDLDLVSRIFNITTYESFFSTNGFNRIEDQDVFKALISPDVIYWVWNKYKSKRYELLHRFIQFYNYKKYINGYYTNVLPSQCREAIESIATRCFDSLSEESDSKLLHELRIKLSALSINRSIDYAKHLMLANLSSNQSMITLWTDVGMAGSKDPSFFSMIWSKIDRSPGYVDKRDLVIQSASRCDYFPESIINELATSGHTKNKVTLLTEIVRRIEIRERMIKSSTYVDNSKENVMAQILSLKLILGRFAGVNDYLVQLKIIPHLRMEDLVFAAPIASKLGINRLVESRMKK